MFLLVFPLLGCGQNKASVLLGKKSEVYSGLFFPEKKTIRNNVFYLTECSLSFYFLSDFQKLTAADDKTAQVEDFLQFLYGAMAQDAIWQNASEEQLQDAQLAIERSVMNRIFKLAFYPNQDGDILRDQ